MLTPSSAANIRKSVDKCLAALKGVKCIDNFECGRVDKHTPLEETYTTLGELVREGKIRNVGISECSANTLRKAHAVRLSIRMKRLLSFLDYTHRCS